MANTMSFRIDSLLEGVYVVSYQKDTRFIFTKNNRLQTYSEQYIAVIIYPPPKSVNFFILPALGANNLLFP